MKKDLTICELNETYGGLLTERQRSMVESYYDYDLSLAEIAQNEGVTRQAVHDAIVKAVDQLNMYESNLGIVKSRESIKSGLLQILNEMAQGNMIKAQALVDEILRKI